MATDNQNDQQNAPHGPKPLSPAVRKQLQTCFERGKQLSKKDKPDHDYAHTMFSECVAVDPSNLEYVEAMLDNLQRKYNNNKKGAKMKGFGGHKDFKNAVAEEDWNDVFRLGFDLLKKDPWDVPTLRALAEACKKNRYNEVELRYLKNALDKNPKDVEVNKHCAESLTRMGQFDQAIACWHRIETLDRRNAEAKQQISVLTVAKTTGFHPSVEVIPDEIDGKSKPRPQNQSADESAKELSEIEKLEAEVKKEDAGFDAYKRLAELYQQENRFRDAIQLLKRGREAFGGTHLPMTELLESAQINQVKSQVTIAEKRAATEKTEEANDLARRFRTELNRQELQIYAARAERHPEDLKIHFELGVRLKRDGNFREAAKSFEKARQDSEVKPIATLEMGECCQQLKQYGNAVKCYQSAVNSSGTGTDEHKRALYRAGILAAALKDVENAEKYLSQLVTFDPAYKDAQARLDKVLEIRDKG